MATQRFPTSEIKGLTPALEPTVADGIFALSGRNYIFDSSGPKSPFGNRLLAPNPRNKNYIQGFRLKLQADNKVFMIDQDGIWEWDEAKGGFYCVYATPDLGTYPYRVSYGYLNGYIFMCHPSLGILCYNVESGICLPHSKLGKATPNQAVSLVVNNGRLIVVSPDYYYWSAPSDGLDFTPTLGGGGFQLVGERVSGDVVCVTSYTKGTLTWTTGGVMRSVFTGDQYVYQHRALNTEYFPVNSFCTCRIDDDTVIILDRRGLFQSTGEAPTAFSPLFNEFLIDYIQDTKSYVGENLRIDWDELQRQMYISISSSYADPGFEQTFVYYPPLEKWGQFNDKHYGIFPVQIESSERAGDYFGYCDTDGRVRYWMPTGSRELRAADCTDLVTADLRGPAIQRPAQPIFGYDGWVMPSTMSLDTVPTVSTLRAGYYINGTNALVVPALTGLDAVVRFGLYRPTGPSAVDECSEILAVSMKSVESGDPGQISLDFNTQPDSTTDLNLATGQDDLGLEPVNYINSTLRIIGTVDGVNAFTDTYPTLVNYTKSIRYYSCSVVGIWHVIEVSALQVGEAFHIASFELTAASAGRIL